MTHHQPSAVAGHRSGSALAQIASALGRRDELPNCELARWLVATNDRGGIDEVVRGLSGPRRVAHDCIKVLYEVGSMAPDLIAPHAQAFCALLESDDNRLVWGAVTALRTVAARRPALLFRRRSIILRALHTGSVITADNAVATLALVASRGPAFRRRLAPALLAHLQRCRPKDVPQHAESVSVAIGPSELRQFERVLQRRLPELSAGGAARIRRLLKSLTRRQ